MVANEAREGEAVVGVVVLVQEGRMFFGEFCGQVVSGVLMGL